MCDTLGIINRKNGGAYFAKNSDRSPNEIQVLEYSNRSYKMQRKNIILR